jgi:ribosomal-protein-alanine N-acetyltransferase
MLSELLIRFGKIDMSLNEEFIGSEVIKTERLLLEPFSEKYLTQEYVNWLNNPAVVRYSEQRHRKHTIESCRKYVESFKGTSNHMWAISVINGGLGHIGNIIAYVNQENKIADISILIGKVEAWEKGYGTEAWKAVCNYAIKVLKLRKVTGGTLSTNMSMLKIMKKAEMVDDGRRRKHYLWEGKEVDVVYAAIFRNKMSD